MVQPRVALRVHCSLAKIAAHIERLIHSRILSIFKAVGIGDSVMPAEGARNIAEVDLRYRVVAIG